MCMKCLLLCKMKCRVKFFVSFLQIDLSCPIVYWTLLCAVFCILFPSICAAAVLFYYCMPWRFSVLGSSPVLLVMKMWNSCQCHCQLLRHGPTWGRGGGKKKKGKVPYFTFSFSVKTFKHFEQMQHEDFMLNECAGVSHICSLIALGLFSKRSAFRAGSRLLFDSFGYSVWSWTLVLKAENSCARWCFGNTQGEPEPIQFCHWSGREELCIWGGDGKDDLTFPWDCSFAQHQSGLDTRIKTRIGSDSMWS